MAGVSPGKYNPLKPDIELFDFKSKRKYGLKLDGPSALQIGTISQDDTVHIRTQGKKIGDFDEQRSWKGGRGIEDLSSNPSGFWDSKNAWTLTEGHVHQTLLWQHAIGLRNAAYVLPNKTRGMHWRSLLGASRYLYSTITPAGNYTSDYIRFWVRKIGEPGSLTFELHSGSTSNLLKSVTITTDDITDTISEYQKFDWTGTQVLASGTTYYLIVYGASTDNKTNHWEVGGDDSGTSQQSTDGSTWGDATFQMYYYLPDVDVKRTFYSFNLDEAFYVVDKKDSGAASQLYINGDRGKATSATSTTLSDSGKSWTTDKWAGARVQIIRGTGRGQSREIASNTSTALTVATWDITPDTTSEYVIYQTPYFTSITAGLAAVSGQPVVANRIVYFPQNTSNIRKMIWNSSTAAHSFSSEASYGVSLMTVKTDRDGILRLWGASSTNTNGAASIVYATAPDYNTTPPALSFSAAKIVGEETHRVTNLIDKEGTLFALKPDGVYTITLNGTSVQIVKNQSGLDKTPSATNGLAAIVHQQFIYFSWLHSVIRVYGSSYDDIGQDWRGWGLPDGREGNFSSFDAYTSLLIAAVDAGAGTSSVLGWDGIGWHELVRAYDDDYRIRFVKVQVNEDGRNFLWTDVGGDLIYQEMPYKKGSPRLDSGARYMHEAVIESAAIDMGTASGLPKFVKELTVYAEHLGGGNEIKIDYQVDDDVHTDNWTEATTLFESPESVAFLGLSNIRKFAYRLRVLSSDNTLPIDILGVVPNGYARVPFKMIWTMRCRADNITSKGRIARPDELMRWLLDNSRFPGRVEMRSQYELAHKFYVIIHPPRMFPYKPAQNGQSEESVFTLVLEEA